MCDHAADFYVYPSGRKVCRQCRKEWRANWSAQHVEQEAEMAAHRYKKTAEERRQKRRAYYLAHREETIARVLKNYHAKRSPASQGTAAHQPT